MELDLPVCHDDEEPTKRPSLVGRLWNAARRLIGRGKRSMAEVLDVEPVSPNRYRLTYSPGVVEGLAAGDEFELTTETPTGFRVLKRGGNLCVWFYFAELGRNRGPDGDAVRRAVEEFGGVCDGGGNTHLVFSVPVSLGFPEVRMLFTNLAVSYPGASWLFGNVYDPFNDFQPLNWWLAE